MSQHVNAALVAFEACRLRIDCGLRCTYMQILELSSIFLKKAVTQQPQQHHDGNRIYLDY